MNTSRQAANDVQNSRTLLRYAIVAALSLACLVASSDAPRAQEFRRPGFPPSLLEKLNTRGDFTLRETTLPQALMTLADEWQIGIVFGRDVGGTVSGARFENAPLHQILDSILQVNGYGYRPTGDGLTIMKLDELGVTNPAFEAATLPIPISGATDNNGVSELVDAVKLFTSTRGQVQAIPAARALVVIDYPDRVERVRAFLADLSAASGAAVAGSGGGPTAVPTSFERFALQHVNAEEMKTALENFVTDDGAIAALEKENVVLVSGPTAVIDRVRQAIAQLDVPRKQVRITAYIYDIALEEMERFGVNWQHGFGGNSMGPDNAPDQLFGYDSGLFGAATDTADAAAGAAADLAGGGTAVTSAAIAGIEAGTMTIRSLSRNFNINTAIQMLDETRGARLLADPKVVVYNLEEATMKAVREVPFQQLTESTEGGAVGTTEFREAGITLVVRPSIADDDTITMEVQPSFSVLAGFQEGQPIIDTREAKTRVRIADGQVIVIGGLRQRSEVETVTGIPHLKDWKFLGKLFRSHNTTIVESELVVFLRPEIIDETTLGTAREAESQRIAEETLDRIVPPVDGPFIPDCRDKYCPYHHPRPRLQGYHEGCIHHQPHQKQELMLNDGEPIPSPSAGGPRNAAMELEPPVRTTSSRRGYGRPPSVVAGPVSPPAMRRQTLPAGYPGPSQQHQARPQPRPEHAFQRQNAQLRDRQLRDSQFHRPHQDAAQQARSRPSNPVRQSTRSVAPFVTQPQQAVASHIRMRQQPAPHPQPGNDRRRVALPGLPLPAQSAVETRHATPHQRAPNVRTARLNGGVLPSQGKKASRMLWDQNVTRASANASSRLPRVIPTSGIERLPATTAEPLEQRLYERFFIKK